MSAHTPGPWTVGKPYEWHGHGFWPIGPVTASGAVVVQVAAICPQNDRRGQVKWSAEDEANARLIAAAPDVLAALKACDALISTNMHVLVKHDDPQDAKEAFLHFANSVRGAIAKAEGVNR